jgi:hypothetical protein
MDSINQQLKDFTKHLTQKESSFHAWYLAQNKDDSESYPIAPSDADLIDAYREWLLG